MVNRLPIVLVVNRFDEVDERRNGGHEDRKEDFVERHVEGEATNGEEDKLYTHREAHTVYELFEDLLQSSVDDIAMLEQKVAEAKQVCHVDVRVNNHIRF